MSFVAASPLSPQPAQHQNELSPRVLQDGLAEAYIKARGVADVQR